AWPPPPPGPSTSTSMRSIRSSTERERRARPPSPRSPCGRRRPRRSGGAPLASRRVEAPTYSVTEITTAVRHLVQAGFPAQVWVEGDIGSISRTPAGNVFFELVEHGPTGTSVTGRLHVVLWDDVRREVNEVLRRGGAVRMTEGVRIRIRG